MRTWLTGAPWRDSSMLRQEARGASGLGGDARGDGRVAFLASPRALRAVAEEEEPAGDERDRERRDRGRVERRERRDRDRNARHRGPERPAERAVPRLEVAPRELERDRGGDEAAPRREEHGGREDERPEERGAVTRLAARDSERRPRRGRREGHGAEVEDVAVGGRPRAPQERRGRDRRH